jgi:four helix bundle protein
MASTADQLADRVAQFALRVLKFTRKLPSDYASSDLGRQLVRAATSESANYRAARRARSRPEFIAKLGLVVEEADETEHWLELIDGGKLLTVPAAVKELAWLRGEAAELRAIFVQSVKTARANFARSRGQAK